MLFNDTANLFQFKPTEASAILETNRVEPELRNLVVSLHVDVYGRFTSISLNPLLRSVLRFTAALKTAPSLQSVTACLALVMPV